MSLLVRRLKVLGRSLSIALCCSCAGDDAASSSGAGSETAPSETASATSSGGASAASTASTGSTASKETSGGEVTKTGLAGASVHYYFYKGLGMLQCPGLIVGYDTQDACDDLGRSQTENGAVNQVGLSCDQDPDGCIVGDRLMVTATDRCPDSPRSVRVTYKGKTLTLRIVDRTPGNGGFDLGLDPYIDLGIHDDYMIGVTGSEEIAYECLL